MAGIIQAPWMVRWRPEIGGSTVVCWLAPASEENNADPTDKWIPILGVNRHLLEADESLFEELVQVSVGFAKRIIEKEMGVEFQTITRHPWTPVKFDT